MLPQTNPSFCASESDAELEWLLCLASALQARGKQTAKSVAELRRHRVEIPRGL